MIDSTKHESGVENRSSDVAADVAEWMQPRYSVLRRLGEGTMGSVFLAKDNTLNRNVAIKVNRSSGNLDRMEREAQVLAQLNSEHVTTVYDFGRLRDDTCCVVMQWIDGHDLEKLIKGGGAQSPDQIQHWMRDVSSGMWAAENARIVHRDLKPSNIIIDRDSNAVVTDFGLANSLDNVGLTLSNVIVGTPLYIAPEQVEDCHSVDSRTDIYSFGATFYHAATGRPPFEGKNVFDVLLKHKVEPLVPPKQHNPNVPDLLNDCIERCLSKNPSDRFSSFAELCHTLTSTTPADPWLQRDSRVVQYLEQFQQFRSSLLTEGPPPSTTPINIVGPNRKQILLYFGNLAHEKTDAVVSSDDWMLTMSGGVSAAIRRAAGPVIETETARFIPARRGRVVVTSAGNLPSRLVFHGITIGNEGGFQAGTSRDIIAEIVDACFYHAETFSIQSIAFPLLGTGTAKLSREIALDTIFTIVVKRLFFTASPLNEVRIVLMPLHLYPST